MNFFYQFVETWFARVCTACVVLTGVWTFGQGQLFDQLFLFVLVLGVVIYRKEADIFSALVMLLLSQIILEVLFDWVNGSVTSKLLVYAALTYVLFAIRDEGYKPFIMLTLCIAIPCELVWYFTDYERTPQIEWYFTVITINLVIRHFIILRPFILDRVLLKQLESTDLDLNIRVACGISIFIDLLNIFEYILRHIASVDSLIVYNLYPMAVHGALAYLSWVVIAYSHKTYKSKSIAA